MFQVSKQSGRLLMIVLLLAAPLSALPQQSNSPAQKWRESEKTDTNLGMSYNQFTLAGKFQKWPEKDASTRPTLEVDCRAQGTAKGSKGDFWHAYFFAGIPLTIEYVEPNAITTGIGYFQKINVRYRLDNGKEKKEQWSPGPDKSSVSIPKDVLKKMTEAHNVLITVNEINAADVSAQFEMPDSGDVAQTCDLGRPKK